MANLRCANCGNYTATLQISVQAAGGETEETAVCIDCVERLERQALGALGPLAPHDLLSRLTAEPEDPSFHCPVCGYDVENLVRTGKLGCVQCYSSFAGEVLNLVRRAIGRESHRGKYPPIRSSDGGTFG
jgi:protein arginine kinase activator